MSIRGICLGYLTILLVVCQAPSQAAKRHCRDVGTISLNVDVDDSYSSATLSYRLEQPDKISRAQIEVWDRPTLLFRTQIKNEKSGKVVWRPKGEFPETPYALWIKVHDPQRSGYADESRVLVGTTAPVEGGPVPELVPETVVLEEDAGTTLVTVKATALTEDNTAVLLIEEESPNVWIAREYLPARLVDLAHIGFEVPAAYLSQPARLMLLATRRGDFIVPLGSPVSIGLRNSAIYVMSKDRPVLSRIEPSEVTLEDGKDLALRILGSGFTPESQILTEIGVEHLGSDLQPIFISDRELQVLLPSSMLYSSVADDHPLNIRVRNGDDQHVSGPQVLTLLPAAKSDLAHAKRAQITAISPYPVPLIDQPNSEGILLKIYGQDFRSGDRVIADNEESGVAKELETKFISSQELSALLPRNLWRSHRLSFQLVTQTSSSVCVAKAWQDW